MFVFVLFFCWLYVCVRVSKVDSWLALPILCMCVLCGVHLLSRCDYTSMCVPLLLLVVFVFHSLYNYCCFPLTSRQPQCRFLLFSVLFSKTTVKLSIIISGIQLYFLLSPPLSMPSNQNHCFFFVSSNMTPSKNMPIEDHRLVRFGSHSAHFANVTLFVQFLFGLVLQLTDVLHGEPVPAVHPAKYLSVENREQSSL